MFFQYHVPRLLFHSTDPEELSFQPAKPDFQTLKSIEKHQCLHTVLKLKGQTLPFRLASSGLISNTSIPCIFPKISNRSNPVACSKSEGIVPGSAPGGSRSSIDLSSIQVHMSIDPSSVGTCLTRGRRRTFKGNHLLLRLPGLWVIRFGSSCLTV